MAGSRKKKFTSGEGAEYWTRSTAIRKLQLSMKDFRRLCILKGIYPREPRHRKKAQKGDTSIRTLYHKKDIQFLMHEPILDKLREIKTHNKKVTRAKSLLQFKEMNRLMRSYPVFKLDHVVKERYPTFTSALADLDDCLTLCFLFSTFPLMRPLPRDQPPLCRQLTFEFLHAIIAGQYLRKVFVSIKGYYFQADIRGQVVTWIVPHKFGYEPQSKADVDLTIMSTFTQFYIVLLGFVNYRLFHLLNLHYPPRIRQSTEEGYKKLVDREAYTMERVAALNIPLAGSSTERSAPGIEEEDMEMDTLEGVVGDDEKEEGMRKAMMAELESVKRLKSLFKGMRVFLSREVPREPLTVALLSFGAQVSWDKSLFVGATFPEEDETITHQICDRPSLGAGQFISRYYVQPQWVFDSVNARQLRPVELYFVGVKLPPHLSPFTTDQPTQSAPLESMETTSTGLVPDNSEVFTPKRKKKKKKKEQDEENMDEESPLAVEEEEKQIEKRREKMKKKMAVVVGTVDREKEWLAGSERQSEREDLKLRERMVPKKYRNLYRSMIKARTDRKRDRDHINRKRAKLAKGKGTAAGQTAKQAT